MASWAPALFGESLLVKDDDGKVSAPNCIRLQQAKTAEP